MDTQMSAHMPIKEASEHYGVSDKTIRRRIKQGRIKAEQINGRWRVELEQDTDQTVDQTGVQHPDNPDLINQMKSEISHLREQLDKRETHIDHLSQILAMQTQQNTQLIEQLNEPRPSVYDRITGLMARLRNGKHSEDNSGGEYLTGTCSPCRIVTP